MTICVDIDSNKETRLLFAITYKIIHNFDFLSYLNLIVLINIANLLLQH